MEKPQRISVILLAAGLSTRMGAENKMLLPYGNISLIQHSYNQLAESIANEIIVVGGRDFDQLKNDLALRPSDQLIFNEGFEKGMTSSIQVGIERATGDGFAICLGDMPLIKVNDYNALFNYFEEECSKDSQCIVVPMVNGQKGNPVIFSQGYRQDILQHQEPNGCKSVIKRYSDHLIFFESDQSCFLTDIDSPDDYNQLTKHVD